GEIPSMPDWLRQMLRRQEQERQYHPVSAPEHGDAWARAAMDGELRRLQGATPGIRNSTLNRVSFRLGQIIGAGLLDQSEIERSLVEAGLGIGLGEREAARTVQSGLTAGIDLPRGPAERLEIDPPGPALD